MSEDEFDDYDFSEFTEEQLALVDAHISHKLRSEPSEALSALPIENAGLGVSLSSGPAIHIIIEAEADPFHGRVKAPPPLEQRVRGASPYGRQGNSSLRPGHMIRMESPFEQFYSWKKYFSVTDLVSPAWCEVQFEYGLFGKKHKPLEQRPSSFMSRAGKEIQVHHEVAQRNDKTLKRGKSVHKALEDELRPEKVVVQVVSNEERFGLRLINLIDGFNEIVLNGKTRELPVFTITHGQLILGVIDEVIRFPLTSECQGQSHSSKRTPTPPPSCPANKKQRRSVSPPRSQVTAFFHSPTKLDVTHSAADGDSDEPVKVSQDDIADRLPPPRDTYELHLADYKTRRAPSLPPDEDTISSRLQLMLYHRMLSSVLAPQDFDFNLLWERMNFDPTKPFSARFLRDIRWQDRTNTPVEENTHVDLQRLVAEWVSTVHSERHERGCLRGINPELQIVYRRSVSRSKWKGKGKENGKPVEIVERDDPLEALALQEELDIACAIQESLRQFGQEAGAASSVAQAIAQNIKLADSSDIGGSNVKWKHLVKPSGSEQEDNELAWAIQQSLLSCAQSARNQARERSSTPSIEVVNDDPPSNGISSPSTELEVRTTERTDDISPIIGTKEFMMDDSQLDAYLEDVLQWWLGARPARGVEVAQSNRCFTCEYRESCEWREKKAQEAATTLERRKIQEGMTPSL